MKRLRLVNVDPKESLFDCSTYPAQVLTKSVFWIIVSTSKIIAKFQLIAELLARCNLSGLPAFGCRDFFGNCQNVFDLIGPNEDAAIVVRKNKILSGDLQIAEPSDLQGARRSRVEPLRATWAHAVTKNRKPNLPELSRIAMHSPNDDAGKSDGSRLQNGEVSDATLVGATAIVDHQHIPVIGDLHGFQKNIDAAKVLHG
jgi:hypothetical protein